MPDLLVRLYALPDPGPLLAKSHGAGFKIRRGLPAERHVVTAWVARHFSSGWREECDIAFTRQPVSCFLGVHDNELAGFACYDATCRGFFGPIGVGDRFRGHGLGAVLLLAALDAMRE